MKPSTWSGTCDELDPAGRRIRTFERMQITYADGPRKLEERYFNPDGSPDYRYEYVYDDAGVLTGKRMFLGADHLHGHWSFQTTKEGRIQSATWFDAQGQRQAWDEYSYDEDERTAIRIREGVGEWQHEYDEAGREARVSGAEYSGAGVETTEYEYDADGYLLKIVHSGLVPYVITFRPAAGAPECG